MFDTLDVNVLRELATLDDRSNLKMEEQITRLTACLEKAATECATAYAKGIPTSSGESYQIAEAGILAAQRIIANSWAANEIL